MNTESTFGLTESAASIACWYWPAMRLYRARMASIVFRTLNPVPRTREVKPLKSAAVTPVKSVRADSSNASTVSSTTARDCGTGAGPLTSTGTLWYCRMIVPRAIALNSLARDTIPASSPGPRFTCGA